MLLPDIAPVDIVSARIDALPRPDDAFWNEAREAASTRTEHHRLARLLPALSAVEDQPPPENPPLADTLRIAAWNAERLKYRDASARLMREIAPDVLLLSEADIGMARSGNHHTVRDLADDLGQGYAYGVEFLEFGLGDERERVWHAGETNAVGFHGNAILSRFPLLEPAVIRLDDGAVWWVEETRGQRRLGWRMAVAARVETARGPLLAVCVHLESKTDAADRAAQVTRLLDGVDAIAKGLPVVLGGDFNTGELPSLPGGGYLPAASVEEREPLFRIMRERGFDWAACNDGLATQRMRPDGTPVPPFTRIDWLFSRGAEASHSRTVPAIDAAGSAVSDHDVVVAGFRAG